MTTISIHERGLAFRRTLTTGPALFRAKIRSLGYDDVDDVHFLMTMCAKHLIVLLDDGGIICTAPCCRENLRNHPTYMSPNQLKVHLANCKYNDNRPLHL